MLPGITPRGEASFPSITVRVPPNSVPLTQCLPSSF